MKWLLLGLGALALLLGRTVMADELTPEQVAKVQHEEDQAQAKVNAAHGNKDSTDMSSDERRQLVEDRQRASQEVFDKNGVSAHDYANASTHMTREDRSQLNAARADLKAKDAAKAAEAAKKPEVTEPKVEYGLPKDEVASVPTTVGTPRARPPKRTQTSKSGHRRRRLSSN